jgi:glutamine synthetase
MNLRLQALADSLRRQQVKVSPPSARISEYYGSNVFDKETMSQCLSADVYKEVLRTIDKGAKMDVGTADAVASAMKTWALSKGATHYTHWFQPLTGATAEKHDSFFEPGTDGKHIEKFKGSALVQQEPDASSFPNGGIRNTFEARGYTAWDPSSPAFIMDAGATKTLCIPTVFVSYTGEALDYKTPLLKSLLAVDKAATAICQEYFDKNVNQVKASLGIEQEYFLIDRSLWRTRPDLMLAGRTVVGHAPAKGQQLDDHYFGAIPTMVQNYMLDFEQEAHKLGIPLRTRHNEVAPRQFECAPQFEEVNLAVDHNQLLMDLMDRVAERHNLKVLLHEKPFAGVNGSGKHNNWSLITNTGKNLLAPSSKAKENLQFLVFFVNTIKAVYEYNDLLRASIATAGNDFRLGANEAPPAIMSVFIGSQLTEVLDTLEKSGDVKIEKGDNMYMKLGISKIPPILLDNTDRNRTSPFAFTGNKFELRAVGSSANSASPMIVLNAIVAEQLRIFKKEVDELIGKGEKKEIALINVLRQYIKDSKDIRFEGNGYGDEWVAEAEKRGLSNVKNTPEALDAYLTEKSKKVFTDTKIFSEVELEARQEIRLENYVRKVQIESRLLGDLSLNQILPAALRYQGELVQSLRGMKDIGLNATDSVAYETVQEISQHLSVIKAKVNEMVEARKKANAMEHMRDMAVAYKDLKESYFQEIRYHVDKLELLVDDSYWPLAKYRELLFS